MVDYALMNKRLYEGDAAAVEAMARDAVAQGRPAQEVLDEGLIAGMRVVGEDFKQRVLYLPEVLLAARAMAAGTAVLKPLLASRESGAKPAGVIVMGTVRGDLHDIGVDQSVEKFLAAADRFNADIVGVSALLTSTMDYMKKIVDGFAAAGKRNVKIAVGGAPVTQQFADEIGADGYCADASSAVELFQRLVS